MITKFKRSLTGVIRLNCCQSWGPSCQLEALAISCRCTYHVIVTFVNVNIEGDTTDSTVLKKHIYNERTLDDNDNLGILLLTFHCGCSCSTAGHLRLVSGSVSLAVSDYYCYSKSTTNGERNEKENDVRVRKNYR